MATVVTGDNMLDAAEHCAKMLAALGIAGDGDTPTRLVRALDELAAGRHVDPRRHLQVRFTGTARPGLIVVTDIGFISLCEHHVLPFPGVATVAYLPKPGDQVVGLSKLARVVKEYAANTQLQERLTDEILAAIVEELRPQGAAVAVRGKHSCMSLRGARAGDGSAMATYRYAGALEADPWRREFHAHLVTPPWRD